MIKMKLVKLQFRLLDHCVAHNQDHLQFSSICFVCVCARHV